MTSSTKEGGDMGKLGNKKPDKVKPIRVSSRVLKKVSAALTELEKIALYTGSANTKKLNKESKISKYSRMPLILEQNLFRANEQTLFKDFIEFFNKMNAAAVGMEVPIIVAEDNHYLSLRCYKGDDNKIYVLEIDSLAPIGIVEANIEALNKRLKENQQNLELIYLAPVPIFQSKRIDPNSPEGRLETINRHLQVDDKSCLYYTIKGAQEPTSAAVMICGNAFKYSPIMASKAQGGTTRQTTIQAYYDVNPAKNGEDVKQDIEYINKNGERVLLISEMQADDIHWQASKKYREKFEKFITELCLELIREGAIQPPEDIKKRKKGFMFFSKNTEYDTYVENALVKKLRELAKNNTLEGLIENGTLDKWLDDNGKPNQKNQLSDGGSYTKKNLS